MSNDNLRFTLMIACVIAAVGTANLITLFPSGSLSAILLGISSLGFVSVLSFLFYVQNRNP